MTKHFLIFYQVYYSITSCVLHFLFFLLPFFLYLMQTITIRFNFTQQNLLARFKWGRTNLFSFMWKMYNLCLENFEFESIVCFFSLYITGLQNCFIFDTLNIIELNQKLVINNRLIISCWSLTNNFYSGWLFSKSLRIRISAPGNNTIIKKRNKARWNNA